jgi:hypothetical protein
MKCLIGMTRWTCLWLEIGRILPLHGSSSRKRFGTGFVSPIARAGESRRLAHLPASRLCLVFCSKGSLLQQAVVHPLPSEARTIPMIAVSSGQTWKKRLQVFAEKHGATELVLKREMSEMSKHVKRTHVNALQPLEGRTSGFHWMAQPALVEFQAQPEFRMFVIDGRCRWGVATRFIGGGESGVVLQKEA